MRYKAFTLIEILVVIGIITGLSALLVPITISQIYYARAESMANVLASSIYSQQQNAFNGYEDSEYGVVIQSDKIIMYTGPSYAQNTNTKEVLNEGVTFSPQIGGGNEIHFEKNNLHPDNFGTIYSSYGGTTVSVTLNSEGMVTINR